MDLKDTELEDVNGIYLAQNRNKLWTVVNMLVTGWLTLKLNS